MNINLPNLGITSPSEMVRRMAFRDRERTSSISARNLGVFTLLIMA
jgi:hypothetical protein